MTFEKCSTVKTRKSFLEDRHKRYLVQEAKFCLSKKKKIVGFLTLLLSFLRNRRPSKRVRHTWQWSAISPSAAGKSSDSHQVGHLSHATELIKQFS
jgi:hypothetical protein